MASGPIPGPDYPTRGFIYGTIAVADAAHGIAVPQGAVRFSVISVATVACLIYGTNYADPAAAPTMPSPNTSLGTVTTVSSISLAVAAPVTDIRARNLPCAGAPYIWAEGVAGISTIIIQWELGLVV